MVRETKETEKYRIAGLNCEKHKMALGSSQEELLRLGFKYMGNSNWRLPPGAQVTHVGYDEEDESDDWIITFEGQTYYVWSAEN